MRGRRASLTQTPFGVLAFDENEFVLGYRLFPKAPEEATERVERIQRGEATDEALELARSLKARGYSLLLSDEAAASALRKRARVAARAVKDNLADRLFAQRPAYYAVKTGFVEREDEYFEYLRVISLGLARRRVKAAAAKRDAWVAQAVLALEEVDKSVNLLSARVREWYGLYFPELTGLMEKPDAYLQAVTGLGRRENFTVEALTAAGQPPEKAESIVKAVENTLGADIPEEDLQEAQGFAACILALAEQRRRLESYLGRAMEEVAPNTAAVAGPILGARLIAYAGSLQRLSRMPSSTVQVLGAEKALFRSLRTGARPPKHGVIFQHPLVHQAPRWLRGKVARALAAKIAIASRLDAFGGREMGEALKADLEKRVEEIRAAYPSPKRSAKHG
ncbi:MAG: C/D box methylation guide ribonucleoprotein complex aNOP56 subunit [Candidatus Bathyarchaeia archaeon]